MAGYYGLFMILPDLGKPFRLSFVPTFVGAPLGLLIGAVAGGLLCNHRLPPDKVLTMLFWGASFGWFWFFGATLFMPTAKVALLVFEYCPPIGMVVGMAVSGWLWRS
jgi:hypothetical protein